MLRFLDFSLDPANAQLRRAGSVVALRPKTFAVLQHLAERPGRLVSKRELLDAVWAETAVGEWVLTGCVRELRQALDDDARSPRIIETAHRLGYRFVANVDRGTADVPRPEPSRPAAPGPEPSRPAAPVGRAAELAEIESWLTRACSRERQVGFVSGEAGIGKTTLVDALRARAVAAGCLVAYGKCLQHHGASEPYLPVLEALGRLLATPGGTVLSAPLRRYAPSWLLQLPGLLEPDEAESLERRLRGTTRERMLREMAALVEAAPAPLVLVIEDLQWSDPATLDLVAALAERQDPAALLVVGTYRPVDVIVREHPLKHVRNELQLHGTCRQLWLGPLGAGAVGEYLRERLPGLPSIEALARVVWDRTDGNPLFVVNVVDHLVDERAVVEVDGRWTAKVDLTRVGVPKGLRQMIAAHADRLSDVERAVLETSATVGRAFSAAVVAAAADDDVVAIETVLERLARREQFVRATDDDTGPAPAIAGGYEFTHALYRDVLGERVPPARRRLLHGRIAACLERVLGARATEVASDLAFHFEASGEPARAVPHLEAAAARAVRRGAHREAVALLEHALALLGPVDDDRDRAVHAIRISIALGLAHGHLHGFAHAAVEEANERARRLGEAIDDLPQLFHALSALMVVFVFQSRLDRAGETAAQLRTLMERMPVPMTVLPGNLFVGMERFHAGDLHGALRHLEAALAAIDAPLPDLVMDLQTPLQSYLAMTLLLLGRPDRARECIRRSTAIAESVGSPFIRNNAVQGAFFLQANLRDVDALTRVSDDAIAIGEERSLAVSTAMGLVGRGRLLAARGDFDEAVATLREGLETYRTSGQRIGRPTMLGYLAEALLDAGRLDEALATVGEARDVVAETGERTFESELWRIEGEVRRARHEDAAAERCFRRALDLAERQGARWWQLRAAMSLARLFAPTKPAAARRVLEPIVGELTEGLDTPDVTAAVALLGTLR